jgi:hypothetical protein
MYGAFLNKRYRMEEYTLVNRFMERYWIEGHWRVRSRNVRNLMIESFVLKKKRKYEMDEE